MSLSKGKLPEAAAAAPRQPKCTRCRHHGIIIPQKGHVRFCPFLDCACSRCFLVTERSRITAMQRSLRRAGENKPKPREKRPNARTGRGEAEPAALGASVGGARALNTSHVSSLAGAPEPLDLRQAAGPDGPDGQVLRPPEERGTDPLINFPCFGEPRPSAPVQFLHVPLRASAHYPSGCASYPALMINVPCLGPVPAALYPHGLYRRLMVPHLQHGALHSPAPPAPTLPADCEPVTLQPVLLAEASQEELMPAQPPEPLLAKQADLDIVGLD